MMLSLLILIIASLLLFGVLAYCKAPILLWTVAVFGGLIAVGASFKLHFPNWIWLGLGLVFLVLNVPMLRRLFFTNWAFGLFKKVMPPLSSTEEEAINAGTVWWESEFFSGKPNWGRLQKVTLAKLTAEEQAFLDGPVNELCALIDDWQINHTNKDLPPEVWQYMKDHKFFALIIKKKYGGLEFSNYAHAKMVTKIGSRSIAAGVTAMVPNSLGPGELLQHYGTEAQKNYYLPRLAQGIEIPCFALTSPYAGSDAGAIPDFGVVCRGDYTDPRTGVAHQNVLGVRLSWEKRWITLAPVATVLGMAFKMHDPEHLLGKTSDIGITCALIPTEYAGVEIGRRHYPSGSCFMNGPTSGKDVFVPLDWIIGGVEYAGQGWRMLMECLSVGRCISLPGMAVAAGKVASYTTGAYARIRDQFGLPIGQFEGVDEAMARIGGYTYQMEASQNLAVTALDLGEKPSVLSAILKYHNTEKMRVVVDAAMDIHGGRAVVVGPRNYLAAIYQSIPVCITVEGANILTRSMMIYGQGAIRCHPYVLKEMRAAQSNQVVDFDENLTAHINFVISNVVRSFVLGVTGGMWARTPSDAGELARYYQQLTRFSSAFALLSDMAMFTLGGSLKFKEKLSARLGDALSNMYIASACLKRFEADGKPEEDLPLLQWAVETALFDIQAALAGFLDNLPNRFAANLLRPLVFPLGLRLKPPSDQVGTAVAQAMMTSEGARYRLSNGMYLPPEATDPIGIYAQALPAVIAAEGLEKQLRNMTRKGELTSHTNALRLAEALANQRITLADFEQVTQARQLKRAVIMVDDFDFDLKEHDKRLLQRHVF
jgi:acyl-CoA dehydrogenase